MGHVIKYLFCLLLLYGMNQVDDPPKHYDKELYMMNLGHFNGLLHTCFIIAEW